MPFHYILLYMCFLMHYYSVLALFLSWMTKVFSFYWKLLLFILSSSFSLWSLSAAKKPKQTKPQTECRTWEVGTDTWLIPLRLHKLISLYCRPLFPIPFPLKILLLSQGHDKQIQRKLTGSFYLSYSSKSYNFVSLGSIVCLLYSVNQKIRLSLPG